MIIFHEGMPGSGKSYAAMKDHIIPQLMKGRKVFARMNGLDHVKISELAGITVDQCRELLVELSEHQVARLYECVENDAYIVVDELQNFFPRGRAGLSPEMTKFIAEHRHLGLDILAMGQLLKDCHATWMNRVNRKIQFVNKDVVGKPNEYRWKVFNGTPDDKGNVRFTEVTSGSDKYDEKYFGSYRSFREETENTERLADDRVNIWKSPMFRKWLPLVGLVAFGGIGYMVYLFNGGLVQKAEKPKPVAVVTEIEESGKPKRVIIEGQAARPVEKEAPKDADKQGGSGEAFALADYVTGLSDKHRIRLGWVVRTNKHTRIVVEWRDQGNQVVEQLTAEDLHTLGWSILLSEQDRLAVLARPGKQLIATAWPIPEPVAKAGKEITDQIRKESKEFIRSEEATGGPPKVAMSTQ